MPINTLKFRELAQRQLTENGGPILITVKTVNALDPATGNVVSSASTPTRRFMGIQMGIKESYVDGRTRDFSDEYPGGTELQIVKAKVFVSPGFITPNGSIDYSVIPKTGDSVSVFGSLLYEIFTSTPLNPNGVILGHELELV